jgi:hypothetical protein
MSSDAEVPPLVWQITKREGSNAADVTLGSQFADLDGPELTYVMRTVGEALIKIGTQFLRSRIDGDGYDDEEEEW